MPKSRYRVRLTLGEMIYPSLTYQLFGAHLVQAVSTPTAAIYRLALCSRECMDGLCCNVTRYRPTQIRCAMLSPVVSSKAVTLAFHWCYFNGDSIDPGESISQSRTYPTNERPAILPIALIHRAWRIGTGAGRQRSQLPIASYLSGRYYRVNSNIFRPMNF